MLLVLIVVVTGALVYAAAGVLGLVPVAHQRRVDHRLRRLARRRRRGADPRHPPDHRHRLLDVAAQRPPHRRSRAAVTMDGVEGELVDISVGGVAVRFPAGSRPRAGQVELQLPEAEPVEMSVVRMSPDTSGHDVVSCRLLADDWEGYRAMSLVAVPHPRGRRRGHARRRTRRRRQQVARAAARRSGRSARPLRSHPRPHERPAHDRRAPGSPSSRCGGSPHRRERRRRAGAPSPTWIPSTSWRPGSPSAPSVAGIRINRPRGRPALGGDGRRPGPAGPRRRAGCSTGRPPARRPRPVCR